MKAVLIFIAALSVGVSAAEERPATEPRSKGGGEKGQMTDAELETGVLLQVFLDRANFGPGKIDGRFGEFTEKALRRYRMAKGGGAPAAQDGAAPLPPVAASPEADDGATRRDTGAKAPDAPEKMPDVSDLDLQSVAPAFIEYTVTAADVEAVGDLPSGKEQQARLKWLPYSTTAEAVAERFHMDLKFFEKLNPDRARSLKEGDVVKVVNVEPFELQTVKQLKPGSAFSEQGANIQDPESGAAGETAAEEKAGDRDNESKATAEKQKGRKKNEDETATAEEAEQSAGPPVSVVVTKEENMLEVFHGDRLIAAYPVTVGSDETGSPEGNWKVRGVAKLPNFRWDEKMLKEGERSDKFHLLPPGPNCPVGVVWIALNKKGIGLHGTDSPDAIGRNASHGCIRLANWDVVRLATMVKTGTPVTIR
jgi:lipoprotein-anchoring transpeptidase ErfK/SrfK